MSDSEGDLVDTLRTTLGVPAGLMDELRQLPARQPRPDEVAHIVHDDLIESVRRQSSPEDREVLFAFDDGASLWLGFNDGDLFGHIPERWEDTRIVLEMRSGSEEINVDADGTFMVAGPLAGPLRVMATNPDGYVASTVWILH